MNSEVHGFFDAGAHRLFGVLHPVDAPARRHTGVVLVHPFMEERQDAHPFLRNLAISLQRSGFPALRVDLYGCGDSAGESTDGTVEAWIDDIVYASARLRREAGVSHVALLGLRFGAALAAVAAQRAEARALALIAPVLRGREYVMEMLRAYIAGEMVLNKKAGVSREVLMQRLDQGESVNLFGYEFTPALRDGIVALDPLSTLAASALPTLIVDVARMETAREATEVTAARSALGDLATVRRAVEPQPLHVEGKAHLLRAESVTAALLPWMEATCP